MRIGDVLCKCECGWAGKVDDCEPDVDGDGNLGCPTCLKAIGFTHGMTEAQRQVLDGLRQPGMSLLRHAQGTRWEWRAGSRWCHWLSPHAATVKALANRGYVVITPAAHGPWIEARLAS
jgi:hypothetical protein